MAPLPTIGNCVRVAINWTGVGGVAPVNVFHLITDSTDEVEIATALDAAFHANTACWQCLMANYELDSYTITLLDGHSAGQVVTSLGTPIVGGGGGNMVPQVAGVLSLHTPQRGPRGRGRLYIGPVGESEIDSGIISAGVRTAMVGAWSDWQDDLAASSIAASLGVASYVHSEVNGVTSVSMRAQAGTQRRRQDQLV